MPDSMLDAMEAVHPVYAAQVAAWHRYRAFGDAMGDMTPWLPQGRQEASQTYTTRLALTHSMGFSRAAVRRIQGVLTGKPASRDHGAGDLPANIVERLVAFDKDCDRTGTAIEGCAKELLGSALTMGLAATTLDKPMAEAADESEDPLPFLTGWAAEEVRDWEADENGLLRWVKLRRDITTATTPISPRAYYHVWRVYDREGGREYRQQFDPKSSGGETASAVALTAEWEHGLGVVPFVPLFARRRGVMEGESYIDELSLADWRKLQYDSDQSMASYLHASPQLTIKTTADLDEVGVGTSHVLKLNPELNEDASYLETATGGMQVREALIESAIRQGFNLAGIDPASVTLEGKGGARAGTALAWSFSTAEAPTLAAISEELERWDRRVHEIATRYLVAGDLPPAHVEVYDGEISRVRSWDLMSAERSSDLALGGWELVKSPTWRRAAAADIAVKVPGNIPDEQAAQIKAELAEADYEVASVTSNMESIE